MIKIKQWCFSSVTIAVSYTALCVGTVLDTIAQTPDIFGDTLHNYLTEAFGDTKTAGRVMVCIAIAVFMARMRSLVKRL